ncbi:MAG TPA: type IV pili methyl-accepting chemotaxis transducer N-terminal domain-containing protein [Kofleriaceae bacterium]
MAGLLVAGQTVIHQVMARQEGDARVINLAGRQRMLGQRLCALTLALDLDLDPIGASRGMRDELARTADDWELSQAALRGGRPDGLRGANSEIVDRMFGQIDADHRAMLAAARTAIARPPGELALADARTACAHQEAFLAGMDRIVTQYEREARQRVAGLRRLELVLLGLALLVLALDGVFVFRPAVRDLQSHLAERDLIQRALAASEAEKQAILRALPDRLLVWSRGGDCAELTADRAAAPLPRRLAELVPAELATVCLERADHVLATGEASGARVRAEHRDHDARLLRLDDDRLLIAIRDVTEVARLEQAVLQITDREQARLAQDLHDGLGQQLIGASFLLRPLRQQLGTGPAAAQLGEKLGQIEHMLRDAIA